MFHDVDPDQTVTSGPILSGSTLFAQTCLSKNLGSLWYTYLSAKQTITVFTPTESTIQLLHDKLWQIIFRKAQRHEHYLKHWIANRWMNMMNEFFNPFNSYFHQFGVDTNKDNEAKRPNLEPLWYYWRWVKKKKENQNVLHPVYRVKGVYGQKPPRTFALLWKTTWADPPPPTNDWQGWTFAPPPPQNKKDVGHLHPSTQWKCIPWTFAPLPRPLFHSLPTTSQWIKGVHDKTPKDKTSKRRYIERYRSPSRHIMFITCIKYGCECPFIHRLILTWHKGICTSYRALFH